MKSLFAVLATDVFVEMHAPYANSIINVDA